MRRLLWAFAIVGPIAAALVWIAWFSPWLGLSQVSVQVEGTAAASAGEFPMSDVEAAVTDPVGTPLLRVDTTAIAERVASVPQVAAVEVTRTWPQGLLIEVQRRTPVAALEGPDGRVLLVDAGGVPVLEVDQPPGDLPVIVAADRATALAVAASLPPWLQAEVKTIDASTRNDATILLRDGAAVRWGSADEGELKATVLQTLLSIEADRYDVSAPGVPTTSNTADLPTSQRSGDDSV